MKAREGFFMGVFFSFFFLLSSFLLVLTTKDSFAGQAVQCNCGNGAVETSCQEICDDGGTDGCCAELCTGFDPVGTSCNGGAGTCDGAGTCVGGGDFIVGNPCGNGNVDSGESCDDKGESDNCCADTCTFEAEGTSCSGGAGQCDASGTCVAASELPDCGNGQLDDGELCDDIAADDCCAKGCGAFEQNGTSCNGGDGTCDGAGTCQPNSNGVGDQGDDGSAANGGSDPIRGGGCVKAPTGSLMGVGVTSFTLSHLFWAGSLTGLWLLRRRKGA